MNENKRIKELETRVLSSSGKSLFDRELMELILYRNVENGIVSEKLIELFKSVGRVIGSDFHELKSVTGMNDSAVATIFCIKEVIAKMLREDLKELPIIENQKKLIDYLRVKIAQSVKEIFYVVFLNKKSQILDEYTQEGTVDKTLLYEREVIKRALLVGATAMVIAHNHPGGSTKPSQHDISMTKTLSLACSSMDIELIDHIIVTERNYFSFAEHNLL